MSGSMYDLQTMIFSPDGRIFQVEYATKAVENSETIIGIKCQDGILIGSEKQLISKLQLTNSNKRIYNIDNSIGCVINGRIPDGRHIVNRARSDAQGYEKQFGIETPVKVLSERVALYIHAFTLYGSYRPFGSSVILAGWDDHKGYQLFMLEPNGNSYGYHQVVSGKGKPQVKTEMQKHSFSNMNCRQALKYLCKMLHLSHDDNKDKIYELEISWVCDESNHIHTLVPTLLKEEAENLALQEIENDQNQ